MARRLRSRCAPWMQIQPCVLICRPGVYSVHGSSTPTPTLPGFRACTPAWQKGPQRTSIDTAAQMRQHLVEEGNEAVPNVRESPNSSEADTAQRRSRPGTRHAAAGTAWASPTTVTSCHPGVRHVEAGSQPHDTGLRGIQTTGTARDDRHSNRDILRKQLSFSAAKRQKIKGTAEQDLKRQPCRCQVVRWP